MRVISIGDVGVLDDMVHIGDEAMFEEFVTQARARGIHHITGISSNPAETAERYGIDAVQRIGFDRMPRDAAVDRMDAVLRAAAGDSSALPAGDPALPVIEAVRASDGVSVTGGGNISSIWPTHIFERATLGALASLFDKPFVVSGQTIGPALTPDDAALVARMLSSAALVGLRERPSYELVAGMGVASDRTAHTIDDASYVGVLSPAAAALAPYCLVTFASHVGDDNAAIRNVVIAAYAALLDHIAASTGLEIVFLPHFGSLRGDARGDSVMHAAVRALMAAPTREIAAGDSAAAAQLARGSSLLVSSRYHPVVFATSAAVPTIGIPVDGYTSVKLEGALANAGQSGILPLAGLLAGNGASIADHVWGSRSAIRAAGVGTADARRTASAAWWDRVVAAFGG